MAMMVGVAVGWALHEELTEPDETRRRGLKRWRSSSTAIRASS